MPRCATLLSHCAVRCFTECCPTVQGTMWPRYLMCFACRLGSVQASARKLTMAEKVGRRGWLMVSGEDLWILGLKTVSTVWHGSLSAWYELATSSSMSNRGCCVIRILARPRKKVRKRMRWGEGGHNTSSSPASSRDECNFFRLRLRFPTCCSAKPKRSCRNCTGLVGKKPTERKRCCDGSLLRWKLTVGTQR